MKGKSSGGIASWRKGALVEMQPGWYRETLTPALLRAQPFAYLHNSESDPLQKFPKPCPLTRQCEFPEPLPPYPCDNKRQVPSVVDQVTSTTTTQYPECAARTHDDAEGYCCPSSAQGYNTEIEDASTKIIHSFTEGRPSPLHRAVVSVAILSLLLNLVSFRAVQPVPT
jgi:hypothetical protein